MVEATFRVEDVLREQGFLTKHANNNNSRQNNNNKDKGKNSYWNRNKQVVNDRVVDSSKPNDQVVLHLASANQQGNEPQYQDRPKWELSTFGESYEAILIKLIAHNLLHPLDHVKICIPKVEPY